MPVFALSGVTKRYDGAAVIDALDLEIPAGRCTVLLGPSGCGKSTLMRLMIGLIAPDAGAVHFEGEPLHARSLARVRRRMGYVIQEGGLFPHLTVRGNLALMPRHLRWSTARVEARIAEVMDLVQLHPGLLGRYPGELSGGQRQRVSLMRALMLEPDVLLLDEPLGALDPMIRADLQHDLRGIFRTLGRSVVLVTHDLAEAAFLADEVVLMHAGRVLQRGPMRTLIDAPAEPFVERFVRAQRDVLAGLG